MSYSVLIHDGGAWERIARRHPTHGRALSNAVALAATDRVAAVVNRGPGDNPVSLVLPGANTVVCHQPDLVGEFMEATGEDGGSIPDGIAMFIVPLSQFGSLKYPQAKV